MQTTWKHRKKAAKRQKVLTIGLAVFTCLCGALAGHWWSSMHGTVQQVTHELEKTKFDLAKAKFELEKVSKIADIRHNIEAVVLQIFDVYRKHSKLVVGCLNRPSAVDRFLDSGRQSCFSHVRWSRIFNENKVVPTPPLKPPCIFTIY